MNTEVKAAWLDALRSGNYKQGKRRLRRDSQFCCLGVLCDLAVQTGVISYTTHPSDENTIYYYGKEQACNYLPEEVIKWADLDSRNPRVDESFDRISHNVSLGGINDVMDYTFEGIADVIEKYL